jgi:hypothetical protein
MNALTAALKNNKAETEAIVNASPDWAIAMRTFDALFKKMADPKDALWSADFIETLHRVYVEAREKDKSCANITVRTVNAMPKGKATDTKKVMLQLANACRIFNASHKVNFEAEELPQQFDEVPMTASAKKGIFTYKENVPSLYPKTSLTFDYWAPKLLDWTKEIRDKKVKDWKNGAATEFDTCTDFMRICLQFIADPAGNVPIAKAEDREAFLEILGEEFSWIKKSAKREDISANSGKLKAGLTQAGKAAGISIPFEAWSRLQQAKFIKPLIK